MVPRAVDTVHGGAVDPGGSFGQEYRRDPRHRRGFLFCITLLAVPGMVAKGIKNH